MSYFYKYYICYVFCIEYQLHISVMISLYLQLVSNGAYVEYNSLCCLFPYVIIPKGLGIQNTGALWALIYWYSVHKSVSLVTSICWRWWYVPHIPHSNDCVAVIATRSPGDTGLLGALGRWAQYWPEVCISK